MLIRSRKFDIRIWVVVNDDGDLYVYLPGYIRTSSEPFSLDRCAAVRHGVVRCGEARVSRCRYDRSAPRGGA
jgi:hypothetical protein